MKMMRNDAKIYEAPWARFKYNLTSPLGEDGKMLTGSKKHTDLAYEVACEGAVLLKNNGALPLKPNTKIALFGVGSIDYIAGGGGSGAVYCKYIKDMHEGFANNGIELFEDGLKFYYDYALPQLDRLNNGTYLFEPEVPNELVKKARDFCDTAVITLHNFSGENYDRKAEKGQFYITDNDAALIEKVTAVFSNTIIVLNNSGIMDLSFIEENDKISAAILAGLNGMEGAQAIADIILGKVNPSGKLIDTYAKGHLSYPSADTYYESGLSENHKDIGPDRCIENDYVCYYEDIYVGYRYFATIPGKKDLVVYPFGFGLSYTDFEINFISAKEENGNFEIKVSVKNIGSMAGKEVVQLYLNAPQGKLGKSKISLVAFAKTKLLAVGESQELTLKFTEYGIASYDDLGKIKKSAYLLEKGEYKFLLGNSSDNLKAIEFEYVLEDDKVILELSQKCPPNSLPKRLLADGSYEELPSFSINEPEIKVEKNPYVPFAPEKIIRLEEVLKGEVSLDKFIAQLNIDELIYLLDGCTCVGLSRTAGFGGLNKFGIPALMTVDGPAGVNVYPTSGVGTTYFPSASVLASTWNIELAFEVGKTGGIEAKECGLAFWLTPGLNIHRTPMCGRNFEYFSEDPLVTGKFAAAQVNGMQSVGVAPSVKHFACNNSERNRYYSDSRVSERALREIYLKGFEICVKEAHPLTIMSSYNILNGVRCCESYELITQILRDEWGFDGLVTSDWDVPCTQYKLVLSGNDIKMPYGFPNELKKALEDGKITRDHIEHCVKHILNVILKLA